MLGDVLQETVTRFPDRVAVTDTVQSLTWASLLAYSNRLGSQLEREGMRAGDTVALVLPNGPAFVAAFCAVIGRGGVALPLDPRLTETELCSYLGQGKARIVLAESGHAERCRRVLEQREGGQGVVLVPERKRMEGARGSTVSATATVPPPGVGAGDAALMQFSSGSTGRPKRLVRTHQQCGAEANHFVATTGLDEHDTIFCPVPLFHAHGLGNGLLASLRSGARLLLFQDPQPFVLKRRRALQVIEAERATFFAGVPMLYQALAGAPEAADLSALRLAFSAGSPLPATTFTKFHEKFGVPVRQLYGCTEAGSISINMDADLRSSWDSVGLPMQGVTLAVVDEQGAAVPAGTTGEVWVRSPALAEGYADDAGASAQAFRQGGFFMGDLGHLDGEGRLYLTGRRHRFIERAGFKVDPAEVEEALMTHAAVRDAVVVGVPAGEPGTQGVRAVVVLSAPCAEADLLRHCRGRLAPFKVPDQVEVRDVIPRSPLGKVLREQLR